MRKNFLISGSIVDVDADKETFEDVTPAQVSSFIKKLDPGDEIQLDITSYGGSVPAGLAIVNLLRQASQAGHKTIAHVIGIAASMASAIACACDRLILESNGMVMLHLPWTMTAGNALDLRKEADTLDKYRDALISVYRGKFDLPDADILKMLEAETFIPGLQAKAFGLNAEISESGEPFRIAACAKIPKFMLNAPKALKEMIMEKTVENQEVPEEHKEPTEELKPEPKEQAIEEETVPKAECEKRVSGMQSAMAKKLDALKASYEAKIKEFEVQAKAMSEELAKAKADATSLKTQLSDAEKELSDMTSAYQEKKNALDTLNASVNTPAQADLKPWKNLHGEELLRWCRENQAR